MDQGRRVLGDEDVGQPVVGQVQMTQVHQFVHSSWYPGQLETREISQTGRT